jgi:site-specific DNA-cytosine methylase
LGIIPEAYFTCEVDADASKVNKFLLFSQNFLKVSHGFCAQYGIPHFALGDIEKVHWKEIFNKVSFDLVIGGSPCQDLSVVNHARAGLQGKNSRLFYNYAQVLDLAKSKNPNVLFLLENVKSMRDKDRYIVLLCTLALIYCRDEITRVMGVNPVLIDAISISATKYKEISWKIHFCRRNRYYWTNIPRIRPLKPQNLKAQDFLR